MKLRFIVLILMLTTNLLAHELEDVMSDMSKKLRAVGTDVRDERLTDTTLRNAVSLEFLATKAQGLTPHKAGELSGEERRRFIEAYKKRIGELLSVLNNLSFSILNNEIELSSKLLKEVKKLRSSGHRDFIDDH